MHPLDGAVDPRLGPDAAGMLGQGVGAGVPDGFALAFWDPDRAVGHVQSFAGGRLARWSVTEEVPGDLPAVFVHPAAEIVALLSGEVAGDAALEMLRVRGRTGRAVDAPPPLDATTGDALLQVPSIVGVSSRIVLHFADAPFGPCDVAIVIEDGRPELAVGAVDDPDVRASLRFGSVLRYMAGDLGLMDMVGGAHVEGEWTQLMLVAGIVESPEFQRALEPAREAYRSFSTAAEVLRSSWYRAGMVAALTGAAPGP